MTDPSAAATQANLKRVRTRHFQNAKETGVKITGLTSYDQLTAAIFDAAGIDFLLVGDSAGNNVFGHDTTRAVTVYELIPLAREVAGADAQQQQAVRRHVDHTATGGEREARSQCDPVNRRAGREHAPAFAAAPAQGEQADNADDDEHDRAVHRAVQHQRNQAALVGGQVDHDHEDADHDPRPDRHDHASRTRPHRAPLRHEAHQHDGHEGQSERPVSDRGEPVVARRDPAR